MDNRMYHAQPAECGGNQIQEDIRWSVLRYLGAAGVLLYPAQGTQSARRLAIDPR